MEPSKRIIVALDHPNFQEAMKVAEPLKKFTRFKVGSILNTAVGTPKMIEALGGEETFLDLKFHDIPNTVYGAIKAAALQKVHMVNVHSLGGKKMMQAAARAVKEVYEETGHLTLAVSVTILTSHDMPALKEIGIDPSLDIPERVKALAHLSAESGMAGVVCSPLEASTIRKTFGPDFVSVTPGIRDVNDPPDDQARTATAAEAIQNGSHYLVIGRPIISKPDPVAAAKIFARQVLVALTDSLF